MVATGLVHAGVMQKVLICNVRKTLFIDPLPTAVSVAVLLPQATTWLQTLSHRTTASSLRAVTPERACCNALDAHSSCTQHRRGTHPSRGGRCCWCMVELNQLLQLLPVIGTDQEHCPMLL